MEQSLRRKIELRVEEKQKTGRARKQIAWLLMVVHAITVFGLIRMARPYINEVQHNLAGYLAAGSLIALALSLMILLRRVKADDMEMAGVTAWLPVVIALLTIVLVTGDTYHAYHHLTVPATQRPGFALAFLLFFLLTLVCLFVYLFMIQQQLKNFFIHSRNQFAVQYALTFTIYLALVWLINLMQ
jgi:hypothetical protein